MKKTLIFLVMFLCVLVGNSSAQWVVNGFETCAADTTFHTYPGDATMGTGAGHDEMSDVTIPTPVQGTHAMQYTWAIDCNQGWGGWCGALHLTKTGEYIDLSSADSLTIWFNNVQPSSAVGLVYMRMKLYEAGGSSHYWTNSADHEEWYFQSVAGFYDAAPGWTKLVMPLIDRGGVTPNDAGFALPGWSGTTNNGVLDLSKIVGYDIEVNCDVQGTLANGACVWDNLQMTGNRNTPLCTFDSVATDTTWKKDELYGTENFTEVTDTPFEGTASLKVNYHVNLSQSWGGYVNFQYELPAGTYYPDMTSNAALYLYVKNPVASTLKGRMTLRLELMEHNSAVMEPWYIVIPVNLDSAVSDWMQILIPLKNAGGGDLNSEGFKVPSWMSAVDNRLDLSKIGGIKLEFSGYPGPDLSDNTDGEIWFDLLIPTGVTETDTTAPLPPAGVSAVMTSYENTITWADPADEPGSTYNLYVKDQPWTDWKAADVEDVPPYNIPYGVMAAHHLLRAPNTDRELTYYYGVTATDKVGNASEAGLTSGLVALAMGVPTIAVAPPANFVADGDLSEWASITPILISKDHGTAHIAPNGALSGDLDCSAKAYIAVDETNLYIAFDVTDDIVSVDTAGTDYQQDCPDLFIGLYDWRGKKHGGYLGAETPDYHLRFSKNRVRDDKLAVNFIGADSNGVPNPNYAWLENAPTAPNPGYTVEAKIPWTTFAAIGAGRSDNVFHPLEGMRIPIDFSINDRDATTTRDCILCYSPLNDDSSWQDMYRWTYTWIGDKLTGIKNINGKPVSYALNQNYPNPFNPATIIRYSLAKPGNVSIRVYDILGRVVSTLVNGFQQVGTYEINFNADMARYQLSSGVYFYTIDAGSFHAVKKMMLIK